MIRYQKQKKLGVYTTVALISLTAISSIFANSSYDKYKKAASSTNADHFRKRTEFLDNASLGLSILSVGFSTMTLLKWLQVHHLKTKIGLN